MSLRVLVVDDSVVFRRAVSEALTGLDGVEVVGAASNGRLALSQAAALRPDLMTLDVEMPELNGIEVLQHMKATGLATGVILLSSLTGRASELTVRALELGAFDFLTKPEGGVSRQNAEVLRQRLAPLVEAFATRRRKGAPARPPERRMEMRLPQAPKAVTGVSPRLSGGAPLVLIGVSTGGPAALARLLPALPAGLNAPVFIVQHMPPMFTGPLAASLSARSDLPVKEAADGERARRGHIYLAPGGRQMKLARGAGTEVVIRITDDPPENNCRPAVDYLFRSAALQFPGRSIAVILTGMGKDGTLGLRLLKRAGCVAIAQDEATCVVFGMPKEAIEAGVVDIVAPLSGIAAAIARAAGEARA